MAETMMRLHHRHANDWQEMVEVEGRRDVAEADAERSWGNRRIFRCVGCDEDIMLEAERPSG